MPATTHRGRRLSSSAVAVFAGRRHEVTTILLFEEADDLRELIRLMLDAPGRRILSAANQFEARELARSTSIDLLVTNVELPGLEGLEIARQMRSLQPGLRVLFISGWYDHPEFPRLERESLLPKPFSRNSLNEAIARVLRGAPDQAA